MTWSAAVASYPVEYELSRICGTELTFVVVATTDQTSYLDTGLPPSTGCLYRVQAFGYDSGPDSNIVEASTTPEVTTQAGFATTAGIVTLAGLAALSALFLWIKRQK